MPGFSQPSNGSAPEVRLGTLVEGGLAPAIMAIVDRGVQRRPAQARALRLEVELRIEERYPPVRIVFGDDIVLVEDGPAPAPGLRITGTLPDLAALMVAPLVGGLPNPIDARGRAAVRMFASRRVRIEGRMGAMRSFLSVVRL
ncbi:MAG TPA: hypothetical protein VMA76_01785, partial [Solirubrobacteraceae bacterium]|nr:hypothetical protein [Solirubrobacteraceae bacterium]